VDFSGCLLDVAVCLAVCLAVRAGLGVLGTDGVGDAPVGSVGLTVDAVSIDLEQDGDAVPGPAGFS
jgi:hypothetical protein